MRYRLRTLLIVMALGPPLIAGAWWGWSEWQTRRVSHEVIGPVGPRVQLWDGKTKFWDDPATNRP